MHTTPGVPEPNSTVATAASDSAVPVPSIPSTSPANSETSTLPPAASESTPAPVLEAKPPAQSTKPNVPKAPAAGKKAGLGTKAVSKHDPLQAMQQPRAGYLKL